ncbi:AfsR/SARP family transcriptional regulator [Micromonospora zhanjiangensis]|uniref:BTAD domain-containing putative transcriptional regulator n=1 Tax=Micromonospora zhanjiangensis TaxID=1522057 RepID=A0ABV8KXD0_9ACTN
MPAEIMIRILGPLEIEVAGARLDATPSERLLLARLALAGGQVVSVAQLVDAVWPHRPPSTARNRIQVLVSGLRRKLAAAGGPDQAIITRAPGYLLPAEAVRLDQHEYERLVEQARVEWTAGRPAAAAATYAAALALWRGPAFDGVDSPFVATASVRLAESRLAVTEDVFEARLAAGTDPDLVADLTAAIEAYPLRERLRGQLMRALHAQDRQGDALAVYRDFHALVRDELGLEPGSELTRLHQEILAVPALPPVLAAAPNQLPADTADFVGRQAELDRLRDVLARAATAASGGCPAIVSIVGPGGSGKTALAVRLAWRVRALYPDGCLVADLDGADPHALLGAFLRALGLAGAAVPADPQERLGQYRSLLADRKVLLVLDNVATAAQLAPLIPAGGGCAVLAVGRRRLTWLPEAVACPLGPLPVGEALGLLSRLAGAARLDTERDDARRLIQMCSGLPLAIRVVGARLAARPDLPVAHLADRLADEQHRLDELEVGDVQVRACLAVSFQRLPVEAQRALRLIALLPGPQLPGSLLGAVLGVPDDVADRAVARLLDEHLLEVVGPHRYRLHDLVRLFAAERAEAEEPGEQRAAAVRRAYRMLLALARAANERMPARRYPCPVPAADPQPTVIPADPTGWLDAERGTLLAFVTAARRLGVPGLAWPLAATLVNICELRANPDDWQRALDQADVALGDAPDPAGSAALALARSILLRGAGHHEQAAPYASRAGRYYRRAGAWPAAVAAAVELAINARIRGRYRLARAALCWALARSAEHDTGVQEGYAYLALGNLCLSEDPPDLTAAQRALSRAQQVFSRLDERSGLANAIIAAGRAHAMAGAHAAAVRSYLAATPVYADLGDPAGRAFADAMLADAYLRDGDPRRALQVVDRIVDSLAELGHGYWEAVARVVRGQALAGLGDPLAADVLRQAACRYERLGHPARAGEVLFDLARRQAADGRGDEARRCARDAARLFREARSPQAAAVDAWLSS